MIPADISVFPVDILTAKILITSPKRQDILILCSIVQTALKFSATYLFF